MFKPRTQKAFNLQQYLLCIAALTLLLIALFTAGNFPGIIERYYTNGVYIPVSAILHFLLGWLPFSLGDVFYTIIILLFIYSLYRFIINLFQKQFRLIGIGALRFIISLQLFIATFYLLWGMNYSRPPAAQILNLQDSTYTLSELKSVTSMLIDSVNARRAALQHTDTLKSNEAIYQTSVRAIKSAGNTNPALKSYFPEAKSSLFTPVINYLNTAGYFNPFTGETQVNYSMPLLNKPITACHEMAHQMGFAREDEANFIGFMAGKESPDRLLRYSAYYMAMEEFTRNVYHRDSISFKQLKLRLSPAVKQDLKTDQAYWMRYQNQLSYVSSLFYDNFLKANNQPQGLRTYNRMIILTMAYYKKVHR
ncbi:DUF3810 domain-containing protein [Mucilaginibacter terrae]|uniref:DUF3810 domain-containing protein n=1 Tax=Mucilaginibacter terrae TaxID=1955052 RepID=A0ABU3GRM5_9SPHI|nr:DUF3810 domain-containing protein [Mucilaginibacter terrae]MDT3402429.1 hypothetical protein [Mucilaginibacter terrae]